MNWILKNLRANPLSIVLMNWQFIIEDSDSFGSDGLASTRSAHKVGYLWSSSFPSFTKMCLDHLHAFTQFKTIIGFNIKRPSSTMNVGLLAYSKTHWSFLTFWLELSGSQTNTSFQRNKWNEICAKYSFQIQVKA